MEAPWAEACSPGELKSPPFGRLCLRILVALAGGFWEGGGTVGGVRPLFLEGGCLHNEELLTRPYHAKFTAGQHFYGPSVLGQCSCVVMESDVL